jgi:predicted transcriptional regulator of viral defense system
MTSGLSTSIDGLRHPAYAGGITEVAKGLWMQRDALIIERLVDYVQRLGVGAVVRRMGHLLEHLGLADASTQESFSNTLTATFQLPLRHWRDKFAETRQLHIPTVARPDATIPYGRIADTFTPRYFP